jgi:hypothetical protein
VEERPLAHHCSFPIFPGWRRGEGFAMVTWLFCAREQYEIPAKGLVDGNDCRLSGSHNFSFCTSFASVTIESNSTLQRIEESAFALSGLKTIQIPASVEVLCCGLHCVKLIAHPKQTLGHDDS